MILPGVTLRDSDGDIVAELDRVAMEEGRLDLTGWSIAGPIRILSDRGAPAELAPTGADAAGPARRYALSLAWPETDLRACVPGAAPVRLDLPGPRQLARARGALLPGFALRVLRLAPLLLQWARRRDPALRTRIQEVLGLRHTPGAFRIDPEVFLQPRQVVAEGREVRPISVIVPVFNAFDLLVECLDRVERHTDVPWRAIVIEDASSDGRIRPWLRDWASRLNAGQAGRVLLIENETNLGFIGSVNRGLAAARDRSDPVVLLNTDALVPEAWAGRLIAPLADPAIASATPMSNDAELFSVPLISARSDLAPGRGDAIDRVARDLAPGASHARAPTGVGFCMAMSPHWLARAPQFDAAFGRGYGEEVDWCQRVAALGAGHVGVGNLFVEHRGGASFGTDEKRRLIERNNAIVAQRFPRFRGDVARFVTDDPLATARLALAIALAGSHAGRQALPLFVAHSLGGGAELYMAHAIHACLTRDPAGAVAVIRVGGAFRWRFELHLATTVIAAETDDFGLIERILAPVHLLDVAIGTLVGDCDPLDLPSKLARLKRNGDDRLRVQIHDYFTISPSYTLLDSDGVYRGIPGARSPDPAHRGLRPDGTQVALQEWQATWHSLLSTADEIEVFSASSAAVMAEAYPDLGGRLVLRPHILREPVPAIATPAAGPRRPVVAALGNIGPHKGLALVAGLATLARDRLDLVVVGNTAPEIALPPEVRVHGSYRLSDLPDLVARYRIGAWLIPSICPETFCYTAHEALATGMPVFGIDLGAQGDAIRSAPNGHVVPYREQSVMAQSLLEAIEAALHHA